MHDVCQVGGYRLFEVKSTTRLALPLYVYFFKVCYAFLLPTIYRKGKNMKHNNCEICGIEFKTKFRKGFTCSSICRSTRHRIKNKGQNLVRYNKTCEVCNTPYETNKVQSKVCGTECRKTRLNAKRRVLEAKSCIRCEKEFSAPPRQKYCSAECRTYKLPKPKKEPKAYIPVEPTKRSCKMCGTLFLGKGRSCYCSKTCRNRNKRKKDKSRKTYKATRKRGIREAKLSCVSWSELQDIWDNCPKGHQVDHIHPLNGENCSGLHVPWNLQYLSEEENIEKSNKFDGTYENESWKINQDK